MAAEAQKTRLSLRSEFELISRSIAPGKTHTHTLTHSHTHTVEKEKKRPEKHQFP